METETSHLFVYDKKLVASRDYWLQKLAGENPVEFLRPDHPRLAAGAVKTDALTVVVPDQVFSKLKKLTDGSPFLLYTTLLASLGLCISRYSGSKTVVIGSPPRLPSSTKEAVGLPIVLTVDPNTSVKELLLETRNRLIEAYQNQDYPYDRLIADLGSGDATDCCKLFDVVLSHRNMHGDPAGLKNDISILLNEDAAHLSVELTFNKDLFEYDRMSRFAAHYLNAIAETCEKTKSLISELEITTGAERQQILIEWNDTSAQYQKHRLIHEVISDQADRVADRVAIVCGDKTISYGMLNKASELVALELAGKGARAEGVVGIFLERSIEMMVGILGALKAGAAYLPLDPSYPEDELSYMLEDAGSALVITDSRLLSRMPEFTGSVALVDQIDFGRELETISAQVAGGNLAYAYLHIRIDWETEGRTS